MGIINCPECTKEISSNASTCPNCGYNLRKEKRKKGCRKDFLILIGVIIGLIVIYNLFTKDSDEYKTEKFNIATNKLFSENLDCNADYEDGYYTVRYENLAKDLNGTYAIRTQNNEFQFRKGMEELHVIPIKNGKTDSENRKIYSTKFGGVIERHLIFALKSKSGEKGTLDLQFDAKVNPEKILVTKLNVENKSECKRGVLYNTFEQKGEEY